MLPAYQKDVIYDEFIENRGPVTPVVRSAQGFVFGVFAHVQKNGVDVD